MRAPFEPGAEPPEMIARPRCPQCAKRLRPLIHTKWGRCDAPGGGFHSRPLSRRWGGTYHGYEAFCSTPCCVRFANAAYRAGYRVKP